MIPHCSHIWHHFYRDNIGIRRRLFRRKSLKFQFNYLVNRKISSEISEKFRTTESCRAHASIILIIPGRVTSGAIFATIFSARIQSIFTTTAGKRQTAFAAENSGRSSVHTNSTVLAGIVATCVRRNFARFPRESIRTQTIKCVMPIVTSSSIPAWFASAFIHLMFACVAGPA